MVRTDISTRLVTADLMLNLNHIDGARQSLLGVRKDFYDWRGSGPACGVLADCVYDANAAMDALMVYNEPGLNWSTPRRPPALRARPPPIARRSTAATQWRAKLSTKIRNFVA